MVEEEAVHEAGKGNKSGMTGRGISLQMAQEI